MSEDRATYNAGPIRAECENPFPLWQQPTPEEVRALIQILGLSNAQVARFVGVQDGKQVRRWKSGEAKIPFAIWGVLMAATGRTGCIDDNALNFAKAPNFMALKDDIEDIQIGEYTKVNNIHGTILKITHEGTTQSGKEVMEFISLDVKELSHDKALEKVTSEIEALYSE